MSEYRARPLKEKDIEAVIAIDALVTGSGGPDRAGFWRGLLSIHAQEILAEDGAEPAAPAPHLCEIAETTGKGEPRVVGFIIGDVQSWQFGLPRHGRIVTIGVHPDHRRRGVATLLAQAIMITFRKMDLPFVHCLVTPGDPLGAFFRSIGFEAPGCEVLEHPLAHAGARARGPIGDRR